MSSKSKHKTKFMKKVYFILAVVAVICLMAIGCINTDDEPSRVNFYPKDGGEEPELTTDIKNEVLTLIIRYETDGTTLLLSSRVICIRSNGLGGGSAYVVHNIKGIDMVIRVDYSGGGTSPNDISIDNIEIAQPLWGCDDLPGIGVIYYP